MGWGSLIGTAAGAYAGGPSGSSVGGAIGSAVDSVFGGGGNDGPSFTKLHEEMVNDIMQKYPREVQSLKMADLNPALAYGGFGKPVSNPVEPTPSYSPDYENNRANTALQASIALAQVDKLKADTQASESVAALNKATAVRTGIQAQIDANSAASSGLDLEVKQFLQGRGRFQTEESKMVADYDEAELRRQYAKSDAVTRDRLDRWAEDQGYGTFGSMLSEEQGRQTIQATALQQYSMPKASAEHDFYLTEFGKSIAPYLQSAESIAKTTGSVRNLGR